MLQHFFISSDDGALHDTRVTDWAKHPLRSNYKRHHVGMRSIADFKATLRAGAYAWPGGYPLYMICDDGGALCFKCARKEAREIIQAFMNRHWRNGWRVTACDINYEDNDLQCDRCGDQIESAYGNA